MNEVNIKLCCNKTILRDRYVISKQMVMLLVWRGMRIRGILSMESGICFHLCLCRLMRCNDVLLIDGHAATGG